MLGLRCYVSFFSSCGWQGSSLVAMHLVAASLVLEHGPWSVGSVVVVREARCSEAWVRGVFTGQGSNLCSLCWQADSLPLSHQESPRVTRLIRSLASACCHTEM